VRTKQRHFSEPGYIPKFYGYCRVSHKQQHDRGTSLADQETRIKAYYQMLISQEGSPQYEFGKIFVEPLAQSAYSKTFPNRPAGRELKAILKPGDQVCVEKHDRLFRDDEDFILHRRWFLERGIGLHIVSMFGGAVDMDSLLGDLILNVMMWMGKMESRIKSERMLLARASRRAEGLHAGTAPPFFCEVADTDGIKKRGGKLVLKPYFRDAMLRVVKLRDEEQYSWLKIAHQERLRHKQVRDLYAFWKRWQSLGRPDINTFKMREFINEYWKEFPSSGKAI
jgi:DNA invertase Pin-like site-specific DNA recombinase